MATKKRAPKKAVSKKRRSSSPAVGSANFEHTLKAARKFGFKKKKPKKPKSKTISSIENYLHKCKEWAAEAKHAAAQYKKLESLKKALHKM